MALGNEASTEPRDEAATAAVADPAQWTPYGGGIIVQAELPKGSRNLCAVALVKQDRENDLFHIFDAQPNGSSESWTSRLEIA